MREERGERERGERGEREREERGEWERDERKGGTVEEENKRRGKER